jgi:phosphatidylinositol glycan class T
MVAGMGLALLLSATALSRPVGGAETFNEALTLRRLPSPAAAAAAAAALATFEFEATLNASSGAASTHTEVFPVAMVQLLQAHRLSGLQLSMTSGFWSEAWGGGAGVPPGLALTIDAPEDAAAAEAAWAGASSAVSGLFCPALAALRYEDTVAPRVFGGGRLYAAKPQEVMCKDHLGNFARLLPCGSGGKARSSLASALAHALTLSNSQFLAVELVLGAAPGEGAGVSYRMSLVVSAVLQRPSQLGALAGSGTPGADVRDLHGTFLSVTEPEEAALPVCCLCHLPGATSQLVLRHSDASVKSAASIFRLARAAAPGTESAAQDASAFNNDEEFATALRSFWDAEPGDGGEDMAPALTGFVAGAPNSYRSLVLQQTVHNPSPHKALVIVLLQPIPWVIDLQLSTLKAAVDLDDVVGWEAVTRPILLANARTAPITHNGTGAGASIRQRFGMLAAWLQPSRRVGRGGPTGYADATAGPRRSPGSLELVLRLPPSSTATVSVNAERSFLYFTDFPSDAARGTDIAAPAGAYYYSDLDAGEPPRNATTLASLLVDTDPDGIVYAAAGMLVPVAWPDFSMPYNVICISCTLPMMVFGAVASGSISIPVVGGHKPRPVYAFILWFLRTCDQLFGG